MFKYGLDMIRGRPEKGISISHQPCRERMELLELRSLVHRKKREELIVMHNIIQEFVNFFSNRVKQICNSLPQKVVKAKNTSNLFADDFYGQGLRNFIFLI